MLCAVQPGGWMENVTESSVLLKAIPTSGRADVLSVLGRTHSPFLNFKGTEEELGTRHWADKTRGNSFKLTEGRGG